MSKKVWPATRLRVYERDALTCRYCGVVCVLPDQRKDREKFGGLATVDHQLPRCRGGSSAFDNLVTACFTCNTQKHRRTAEEYLAWRKAPSL